MGIFFNNITENFILDIAIYLVIFSVMYYMIFAGKKFGTSLMIYIIGMEIKFFIEHEPLTLTEFIVSFCMYLILGLLIVKISYKMADYYVKSVFVIVGTMVAYILEILLTGILFIAVGIPIGLLELFIYAIFH